MTQTPCAGPVPAPQRPAAPQPYEGTHDERVALGARLAEVLAPYTTYGEHYHRGILEVLVEVARAARPERTNEHYAWADLQHWSWALAGRLALRHDSETGDVLDALPELDVLGPALVSIGALAGEPGAWRLVRCPR